MINVLITGDFCPRNRIEDLVLQKEFSNIYNDFLPLIKEADISITNLECPLIDKGTKIKKTGPNLKAPQNAIDALTYGGFNIVTLANNHIMDYGDEGLVATLKSCKSNGIEFVGVGSNLNEARKPLYKTINGITLAIVNFCENEFSTTSSNAMGANPLNPILNYYDIKETKLKAQYVFVIIHGGHEYYSLPSPRMQEAYRFFIDAGADAVIGHHIHCFSGYELYQNKPIFYSLGNFIFDAKKKRESEWNKGYAVKFTLNETSISFSLHPYIQGDGAPGVKLMNKFEEEKFKNEITQLNDEINDSKILEAKFKEFITSSKKKYFSYIQPYTNKYLLALYKRGLIPSIISRQNKRILQNICRCEAHRDVLIEILKE